MGRPSLPGRSTRGLRRGSRDKRCRRQFALVHAQPRNVILESNLLPGHASPRLLLRSDRNSKSAAKIDVGGR
ncbi:hypothetical protein A1351_17800 [Methylosinus sp. R-45379]|nr:hypothetical protein A1351_17800 [Methylosinus sp. R-45379]